MINCEKCGSINPDDSIDCSRCGATFTMLEVDGLSGNIWVITAKFVFFFVLGSICVIGFIVKHVGPAFIFGPPALLLSFKYLRAIQSQIRKGSSAAR